ncbi:Bug family tripartite tricarboxylate transporter substrate binding protein [Pseudorhodoplanes sp.]|uniref:Bug family tripartite tricarboxylate transporter substrate binding protein n=1 Tax=Pseudorhodoplanes sp. TaxID=1934341 RepID=UPI00391DB9F0
MRFAKHAGLAAAVFGLASFGPVSSGLMSVATAQTTATQPIRVVVGVPAGGVLDPYARIASEHMEKTLGRPMIIENKPGANGNLSALTVVDAPADGQLIWIGTQSMTEINPSAYSKLRWSMKDFVPIIRGVSAPLVLVTHPSVPAKTLPELIDYLKKNPGKLGYASFSPGTPSHFLGFQMNEKFGLDLAHIPYKGSGQQTTDLVAGHALMGFSQLGSTIPHIASGQLNAIAVTGPERSRFLPNVPTMAELGHPDFTTMIWFGMFLKAGTPQAIVDTYVKAAKAAHTDPDVKTKLEALGFDVPAQTGPAVAAEIAAQTERWAKLIRSSGFKAD